MSKVTKFIKNNIKFILGIIVGGILFGGATYVIATEIASSNITYTGNGQTTVQGALNDLYGKANQLNTCNSNLSTCNNKLTSSQDTVSLYQKSLIAYSYWRGGTQSSPITEDNIPSTIYALPNNNNIKDYGFARTTYYDYYVYSNDVCIYRNGLFCINYNYWSSNGSNSDSVAAALKEDMEKALRRTATCTITTNQVSCTIDGNTGACWVQSGYVGCYYYSKGCYMKSNGVFCDK